MRHWWSQRPRRERRILLGGVVVALVVLAWVGVWEPLGASRDALRAEAHRQQGELAWMRPAVTEALAQGQGDPPAADGRSLLARIDASVRESGLGNHLVAVEPQGNGRVSVRLSGTQFDRFAAWLEQQVRAGLVVEAMSVQRAAAGVDVRVELREGAG